MSAVEKLTPRQLEILTALANGKPRKQIAAEMGISDGTVNAHFEDIYQALGVNCVAHAAVVATKAGLV